MAPIHPTSEDLAAVDAFCGQAEITKAFRSGTQNHVIWKILYQDDIIIYNIKKKIYYIIYYHLIMAYSLSQVVWSICHTCPCIHMCTQITVAKNWNGGSLRGAYLQFDSGRKEANVPGPWWFAARAALPKHQWLRGWINHVTGVLQFLWTTLKNQWADHHQFLSYLDHKDNYCN